MKSSTKNLLSAEAVQHRDIRGKIGYYLKITNEFGEEFIISIGSKTFNACYQMMTQTKMEFKDNENKVVKDDLEGF